MILIGYGLGESVTLATCKSIWVQIPAITLSTFFITLVSAIYAYYITKRTDINLPSSLIGNMPGGMTQMILVGEEIPGTDHNVIVVMQTARLILTIMCVPFIVLHAIVPSVGSSVALPVAESVSMDATGYIFVFVVVVISVFLANKVHFPAAYLLGPLFAVGLLNIFWQQVPHLPKWLLSFAQIFVGVQMGANIQVERIKTLKKHLLLIFSSTLVLIAICFGVSEWLSYLYDYSMATAFLATAPGGISEMSITALSIGADGATVLAYQLFRVIFLSTVIPIFIRWYFIKNKNAHNL